MPLPRNRGSAAGRFDRQSKRRSPCGSSGPASAMMNLSRSERTTPDPTARAAGSSAVSIGGGGDPQAGARSTAR